MLKQILNIFVTAETVKARHFDDGVYAHACIGSVYRCTEQSILSSDGNRPDRILSDLCECSDKLLRGQSGRSRSGERIG